MTQALDWQGNVGRKWAQLYALTDRAFTGLTQHLLERIERLEGSAVLDIGCGAGELSLALARMRPRAAVVGLDLSGDLVAAARMRGGDRGSLSFVEGDAAVWEPGDFRPDLLVSRHGVMFFDDPPAAFAHLRAIAEPDAALIFSCFRDRRLNPWADELAALLPPELAAPADPLAPGPFAFAQETRIAEVLGKAGWGDLRCEPFDFAYIAGMGEDPVADASTFLQSIGPAAQALEQLRGSPAEPAVRARLADWIARHASAGLVAFPAAAWIVSARRD